MDTTDAKRTSSASGSSSDATVSLEDLAREQGVQPVLNLDELDALWPVNDDPDAFLAFIQSERAAQRAGAQAKARNKS